jgi:hypothetical protein
MKIEKEKKENAHPQSIGGELTKEEEFSEEKKRKQTNGIAITITQPKAIR